MDGDLKKLNALIGLRNAFAHDFNLVNDSQQHRFTVYWQDNSTIVTLPENKWNGNMSEKDFFRLDDVTFINLFGLGNMVENIYIKIIDGINNDTITTQQDTKTIINKYTFIIS